MGEILSFFTKAYFFFTSVRISSQALDRLIDLNITIELYDVDKINCEDGIVHFIPMRCIRENHSAFTEDP